jgi:hypothetical protein
VDGPDYHSGDDVVLDFVGQRYAFSAVDFRERVAAAAIRLGLVAAADLDQESADDLVDIAATGALPRPRSALGRHLGARWSEVVMLDGHSLVYWLRKLVFRGAWLDERLKRGMLDVVYDPGSGAFQYRLPNDTRPLVDVATHPSWSAVRFRPGG